MSLHRVYIVQIYNPGDKEYTIHVMSNETYFNKLRELLSIDAHKFIQVIKVVDFTQEEFDKIKADI